MHILNNLFLRIAVLFMISSTVMAENAVDKDNFPVYQQGTVIIPRIDTPEKSGVFRNATLQFDGQIDAWRLLNFEAISNTQPLNITQVTITDSFPIQVFLHVNDSNSICSSKVGQVNQRLNNGRFEVSIDVVNTYTGDPLAFCVPYQEIIQLSVYGLDAGIYEYSVNYGEIGTFNLIANNRL